MSTRERASLGFDAEFEDFDPSSWNKPDPAFAPRLKPDHAQKAAEAAGFRSREPKEATAREPTKPRRRRTGRNVQFNIKTRQETIDQFCAIADAKGWGLGETLEIATELLRREHIGDNPKEGHDR